MKSEDDDYVRIGPDALLRATGQIWKLVVAGMVLPWPTLFLCLTVLRDLGSGRTHFVELLFILVSVGLIAALLASVRCPRCRVRWLRRVLKDPDGTPALTRFLNMRSCPECGYRAEPRREP